jgi:hypothetical protein
MSSFNPRGKRPLRPGNLRANDDGVGRTRGTYASGDNVVLAWSYRIKDGKGRAAGEQLAGQIVGPGIPTREGRFRLRVYEDDGTTLKRTWYVDDDTGETIYSNANLVSDFGTEPDSFIVELVNIDGTWVSDARRITINKRT